MKRYFIFLLILIHTVFANNSPVLYFTPKRQADKIITSLIEGAKKSVYIAGYSVSYKNMVEVIREKKEIDIRIITDKPIEGLPESIVRIHKKSGLFHPKFITVDDKIVLVGSGNFTYDGLHLHHNHFLLIQDKNIARFFNKKFLTWWKDILSEETETETQKVKSKNKKSITPEYQDRIYQIYFSPETDCESVIVQEILKAKKAIHFAQYRFNSVEIAKAIILKKMAGVSIYGIMDSSGIEPYSVFYPLSDYGCKLKKSNLAGFLHDKLLIIDGEAVITGSYNLTASARRNVECLAIIKDRDTASKLLKEWKKLWLFYSLP